MRLRKFFLAGGLLASLAASAFAQEATTQEPVTPPIEVRPPATSTEPVFSDNIQSSDPFADWNPTAFPSLRAQGFSGQNGALRLSERSVFDTPQMVTVTTQQELRERSPQDMFQALQTEVGVMMQQTARGQASPFIRGLTGPQVLILVDGIRMNNSTYRAGANQYFDTIDPGQVERIEVIRGAGSVAWGSDAIGGVINVVTKSASQSRGQYGGIGVQEIFSTADAGSYTRFNLEGWTGQGGVFAGASYLNVNDLNIGGPGVGEQPFTSYDQYAADVKVDRLVRDSLFTFAVQHFEQSNLPRSDRFPPFVLGPPVNTAQPTFFDPQQRDMAYARLQGLDLGGFIDAYSITGSYQRQKEGTQVFNAARTTRDDGEFTVETAGFSIQAATLVNDRNRVTYGVDTFKDTIDSSRVRGLGAQPTLPLITQFPDNSYYTRTGIFSFWDTMLTERLNMIAGIRYETIKLSGTPTFTIDPAGPPPAFQQQVPFNETFDDWIASVGLVYELTDSVNLIGGIYEGFRAPSLDDSVATNTLVQQAGADLPTLGLLPERSLTYEIGFKVDTPRTHSQAVVFWNDLENNIVRVTGANGGFQRANQDSYIYGVEWAGEFMLTPNWSPYANFSYTQGQNLITNQYLSRVNPEQGLVGLRWRSDNARRWLDFYAFMSGAGDKLNLVQDLTDARIPPGGTPAWQTLNMRAGITLGQDYNHQLSLNLQNLADQNYRVHGSGVDGAGFNAILGYSMFR